MLPYLSYVKNPSKQYTVTFRGLNYGEGTQDGEFADTYNLSTDEFPCITQRAARVFGARYLMPSTLHAKGNLLVIDGENVLYGGKVVGEVTIGKKQTATIGNYIVIFPDKKYYRVPTDTEEGEFGSMEEIYSATRLTFTSSTISRKAIPDFPFIVGDVVTITGCSKEENNKAEKVAITKATIDKLAFEENSFIETTEDNEVTIKRDEVKFAIYKPKFTHSTISIAGVTTATFPFKAGDVVTVTGGSTYVNRQNITIKSATPDELTFEDNTFELTGEAFATIVITCVGVEYKATGLVFTSSTIETAGAFPFREGDAVSIEGCSNNGNNKVEEIIIRSATPDELTFDANAFTEAIENGTVTIKRTVPDLDFICESNYRLWGTHGNTIYSSKFSDPFNFKVFDNLVSDSYAIEVGSEGEFTGCIPYSSHICFFKENTLHKLYGTKPSNFQITTVNVYGVQSGSEKSMQIVNEQLLYKGVGGVYAYTGGVPELISPKFGNNRYSDAVACCDGEKYYISMKQGETWHLFTYDVMKNIWLREDDTHAIDMVFYDGKIYYIQVGDGEDTGGLYYIDKTADRSDIEWGATFCTMHETINERKGYSKFHLRMDLSAGAWLAVDMKTDNDLQWKQIYTTHNEKAKTVSIPIIPTRCDSIDIRLRGKGKCTIKTFIREFTTGSDA